MKEKAIPCRRIPDTPGCIALLKYGNYLYAAGNDVFSVYDVTRADAPVLIRKRRGFGCCRQFARSGNRLYLTARENGLWIFDLADPAKPRLIHRYDTVELATGIAAAGDLVFLLQRIFGVEILDCSDPRHPRHLSLTRTQEAQSAAYADGRLYIGNWAGANVQVMDVRDPRHPVTLTTGELGGFGDGVAVADGYCYAATGLNARGAEGNCLLGNGHGLDIFRIDGDHLQHLSRVSFPLLKVKCNDFWTVRVCGKTAFVADTHNGVFVLDVSDPAHPVQTGHILLPEITRVDARKEGQFTIRIPDCAGSLALGDGVLYIAGDQTGLHVAGIKETRAQEEQTVSLKAPQTPAAPDPEIPGFRQYDLGGQVRRVWVDGDRLFTACSHAGIQIFDLKGNQLEKTGHLPVRCSYDVTVRNGLLYSAEGMDGLAIYSISDHFRELGRWKRSGIILQLIHLSDNGRFAACGSRGGILRIFDVADPAKIRLSLRHLHGGQMYGDTFPEHDWKDRMPMIWPYCGLSWYDFSGTKARLICDDRAHATGQTQGITLLHDRFLMNTMRNRFQLIDPDDCGHSITELSTPGCDGVPTVDGDRVAFSCRRDGEISLFRFHGDSAERLPNGSLSSLRGTPDRIRFHKGKMIIPCGHQGLLIEQ